MQTTLLSLAIAVIMALLAALLGPYFIDWNAHRATFETQASEALGLPVRVTGPMDVRLLPTPLLVLSGVEIGKQDDPQAVRAKALAIEFALPPLFSGKLRAVEMRLIAPEVKVSLTQNGRVTVPALLDGVSAETFSIDKLNIEDARVELSDAASGARAALSKLWFNGEVRALPGPIRGEGAFVLDGGLYSYRLSTGRPEAAGSRVRLSIDPSDRPVTADVEGLVTAEGGSPRFEGQATLARRVASSKGDKAPLQDPWRVTARVKANAANALLEQLEFQYGPDDRALKLAGTAEAKFGAQPRLNAVLSARQLDADKALANTSGANLPPRAALAAVLSAAGEMARPPIPTQIGFGIDVVTLGGAALQNVRGDIELAGNATILSGFEARGPGYTQMQASGEIHTEGGNLSFTGPVDVTSSDPRIFADWLEGKAIAALPSKPGRLRGDVSLGAGKVAIERMQAELDRKAFDGSFVYSKPQDGERSRIDLNLRADDFDLDALMQFAGSMKALTDVERPDDVALSLALGRLRFAGVDAGKADVKLALNADGLNVERFSVGDLGGLSVDGHGRIDLKAQAPRGGLSFNIGMRDPSAFVALANRLSPGVTPSLEKAIAATAPAKLSGSVAVEPFGNSGASQANIVINGALGSAQLNLKSSLTGQWKDAGQADVVLDATLDAADVNTLVTFAAADKWISVPRQPGTYTISLRGKRDGDMKIDTRIAAANLDARANGTVRPFAVDKSAALEIAVGRAAVLFNGKPVPVILRTVAKADSYRARLDGITATIAGTVVRGQLGLSYDQDIPVVDGELKTSAIDFGAFFSSMAGLDTARVSDERWSTSPFVMPALPSFAGEVKVEAGRAALLPSFAASKLQATLRFSPTQIKAEAIEGDFLGGRGSAEVTMRRNSEGIGMQGRLSIKGADAAQLLFGEGPSPALTGRANLNVQFEGGGLSPRAIIGSLNGAGVLTLEKARIASLDPIAFSIVTRSVDQGLPLDAQRVREVVSRSLDAGSLSVPSADASLAIAGGIVRIETFAASLETAELAMTGSYNLVDARLDARLALTGAAVAGAPMRPELVVLLRGPASAPERSVDVSMLTGWLALRSVDRQTKRIEAIEQGKPAEAALQTHDDKPSPDRGASQDIALPDIAPVMPRPRPAAPQPHVATPNPQPNVDPLPAPVEIRPAAGERKRVPQRVEGTPRGANPFPQPMGNPFPEPLGSPPAASSPSLFR